MPLSPGLTLLPRRPRARALACSTLALVLLQPGDGGQDHSVGLHQLRLYRQMGQEVSHRWQADEAHRPARCKNGCFFFFFFFFFAHLPCSKRYALPRQARDTQKEYCRQKWGRVSGRRQPQTDDALSGKVRPALDKIGREDLRRAAALDGTLVALHSLDPDAAEVRMRVSYHSVKTDPFSSGM